MDGRQDYFVGITGGALLSIVPSVLCNQLLEAALCAAVGAVVSFLVSKGMRSLFTTKQK